MAKLQLALAQRRRGIATAAQQYGTTLVTLDWQQLERLPPTVKTVRPGEVLGEREGVS